MNMLFSAVFLIPTAKNGMIIIEPGSSNEENRKHSSNIKKSVAQIIVYQYSIAPLIPSETVMGAVYMPGFMVRYSEPMNTVLREVSRLFKLTTNIFGG